MQPRKPYGLHLRVPPAQSSAAPARRPPASIFGDNDDDVEKQISRQASTTSSLQKVEQLHNKALEEDSSVFDYDAVYDDMKDRPNLQDKSQRKSKYIEGLMAKAKEREREHEITYERKLIKERSKEDHLFADKEKFVTSAYRKKLAEQAKWLEEDRLRQIQEDQDDVTRKKDLSEFYFGLNKNIALGGGMEDSSKQAKHKPTQEDAQEAIAKESVAQNVPIPLDESKAVEDKTKAVEGAELKKINERFKSGDDIASLREKYMARKKAKEQL